MGEFNRFRQYVNKKRTFDFVIDALNTASYGSGRNILQHAKKVKYF